MSYLALVLTVLLAAALWRVVKWMLRSHSPVKVLPQENKQSQNTELNPTTISSPIKPSNSEPLYSDSLIRLGPTESKTDNSDRDNVGLAEDRCKVNDLQQKLCQEVKRRESVENWAEFLTRELDSHIEARTKAEKRCRQLATKLNPASQQFLREISNEPLNRSFKSLREVQEAWAQRTNKEGNSCRETNGKLLQDEQYDETEWNKIVAFNLRFLQAASQQNTKTEFKERNKRSQISRRASDRKPQHDESSANRSENTVARDRTSPEKLIIPKVTERASRSQDSSPIDLKKLVDQDRRSENEYETFEPASTAVCRESIENIKKTAQLWENLSSSKDRLSSSDDSTQPSPVADSNDKKAIQESLGDIKTGLVKQNSKLYENN